jgi:hypothetical protein
MDINALIEKARKDGVDITGELRQKSIRVPAWETLKKEYEPSLHPVMDEEKYPDVVLYEERLSETEVDKFGNPVKVKVATGTEKVSRVTYALQKLAAKRTTELCFGIPVQRIYKPQNDRQKELARYIEAIFQRTRIDSVNIDRGLKLFASCEFFTLWYGVKQDNDLYGFPAKIKMRCATFSPMTGDDLYPLFNEYGDMLAMSFAYTRRVKDVDVSYFDTYTADTHLRWSNANEDGNVSGTGSMSLVLDEKIETGGKIPGVYCYRPLPVWEDASPLVYEMEWAVSRDGNYLRSNSRPILMAAVGEQIGWGQSPPTDRAFKDILQFPPGSSLQYVTWNQAIDNLKFYVYELRQMFFTQLQLPDWSYENMKTSPMSGEARKQLFIDCHLKVKDESGRLVEALNREVNVVKAFLKVMLPGDAKNIEALPVENVITPYVISDEKDTVELLLMKNGNKPLTSQQESIQELGESEDPEKTMELIRQESMADAMALAM